MKNSPFFKLSAIAVGVGINFNAFAAGFQINEVSPTIQATALADAATAVGDISGMAFNPAILGTTQGTDIYVAGSIIAPEIGYSNAQSTLSGFVNGGEPPNSMPSPGTVTSESNISSAAVAPALYMGTHLPQLPNIKIGLGVDTPFGLSSSYDQNWVGQYNALDSTVKAINVFPTLAWQIIPGLAIGAAVNFEYISANYSNNFFQYFSIPNFGDATLLGSSILHGSSWGAGYVLGAVYTIAKTGTTLGADYHSSVRETIQGTDTIGTSCNNPGLCGVLPIPENGIYGASVNIRLPASVNFGVAQKITSKLTLMAGAQWTQWDSIQAIDATIDQIGEQNDVLDYQNAWLYSLGASYLLTPKWTVMGGLAYDATPTVNQYRDARIPDTNRKWITGGVQYAATQNLSFFGTYEHIFMNDQSINESDTSPNAATATISADYSGYANVFAAGLNYKF